LLNDIESGLLANNSSDPLRKSEYLKLQKTTHTVGNSSRKLIARKSECMFCNIDIKVFHINL
jgi:DNA-directed RNA polymerase subunit L